MASRLHLALPARLLAGPAAGPVRACPRVARHDGTGDWRDPRSFACATP